MGAIVGVGLAVVVGVWVYGAKMLAEANDPRPMILVADNGICRAYLERVAAGTTTGSRDVVWATCNTARPRMVAFLYQPCVEEVRFSEETRTMTIWVNASGVPFSLVSPTLESEPGEWSVQIRTKARRTQ